jgi:hypothetical protein
VSESCNIPLIESSSTGHPIIGPLSTPTPPPSILVWKSDFLPTHNTPVPSPTAYFTKFYGAGSKYNWYVSGFFGDESLGLRGYSIAYRSDFILINRGNDWVLEVSEVYNIGVILDGSVTHTNTTFIFDMGNGETQTVYLGELDVDQYNRHQSFPLLFQNGYPTNARVEVRANIDASVMIKPPPGSYFEYKFGSLDWR